MAITDAVNAILESAVQAGDVPGVVAMAADDGEIYEGAFGKREVGSADDPRHGLLDRLDDQGGHVGRGDATGRAGQARPRRSHRRASCPSSRSPQVLEGFDAPAPDLRSPAADHAAPLLTHTAGFAYNIWNADMAYYGARRHPGIVDCQNAALNCRWCSIPASAGNTGSTSTGSARRSSR